MADENAGIITALVRDLSSRAGDPGLSAGIGSGVAIGIPGRLPTPGERLELAEDFDLWGERGMTDLGDPQRASSRS